MKTIGNSSRLLSIGLVLALMAGCGGVETAAVPPTGVASQNRAHRSSGSYSQVLYVYGDYVEMLTYPDLKLIAQFPQSTYIVPDCADDATGSFYFLNFAHVKYDNLVWYPIGGTNPSGTLNPPAGTFFNQCNADPTTGNLAVLIYPVGSGTQYVGVYPPGSTSPQQFADPNIKLYASLAYDAQGNLFVEGSSPSRTTVLAELPHGSSQFIDLSVSGGKLKIGGLEWDGTDLAVRVAPPYHRKRRVGPPTIERLAISGSSAQIIGTTLLPRALLGDWIQGDTVIAGEFHPQHEGNAVFYHYPAGGKPYKVVTGLGQEIVQLIVATAQSH